MDTQLLSHAGLASAGAACALFGGGVLFFVGRRRFARRNVAGIEEFAGYGSMLVTRLFEGALRLAAWLTIVVGLGLMLTGVQRSGIAKPRPGAIAAAAPLKGSSATAAAAPAAQRQQLVATSRQQRRQ